MKYQNLRDFIAALEKIGELKRIKIPVDTHLEMTEICDRVLRAGGPALLFEQPKHDDQISKIPVLANLFGTARRVALGMGEDSVSALREVGKLVELQHAPLRVRTMRVPTQTTIVHGNCRQAHATPHVLVFAGLVVPVRILQDHLAAAVAEVTRIGNAGNAFPIQRPHQVAHRVKSRPQRTTCDQAPNVQ